MHFVTAGAAELRKLSAPNDERVVGFTGERKNRAIERFFKSSDNGVIWLCNCRRPKQITRLIDVRHYFNQYQTDRTAVSLFIVSYPEYIDGQGNEGKKEDKKEGKEGRKEGGQ